MDDFDGAPEVRILSSCTRTARKARRCDCCRGTISAGERYQKTALTVDGMFEVSSIHPYDGACAQFPVRVGR